MKPYVVIRQPKMWVRSDGNFDDFLENILRVESALQKSNELIPRIAMV